MTFYDDLVALAGRIEHEHLESPDHRGLRRLHHEAQRRLILTNDRAQAFVEIEADGHLRELRRQIDVLGNDPQVTRLSDSPSPLTTQEAS